jgi:hypothetical protein
LREGGSEKPPIVVQAGIGRAEGRGAAGVVREGESGFFVPGFTTRAREILETIQQLQLELARELRLLEAGPLISTRGVPLEQTQKILAETEKVVPPPVAKPARQGRRKRA